MDPRFRHSFVLFLSTNSSPYPSNSIIQFSFDYQSLVYRETRRLDGNSLYSSSVSSRSKNPTAGRADHTGENASLSRRVCVAGTAKPRN